MGKVLTLDATYLRLKSNFLTQSHVTFSLTEVCFLCSHRLDAHFHKKAVDGSLSNWKTLSRGLSYGLYL